MNPENWHIIGHEWAVKSLQQHAASGNQKQAYLFTGPESVGRRTLAIRFSQALNCLSPVKDGIPCMNCTHCGQFERMVHPDLTVVRPEQDGEALKVEQVRDFQYNLYLAPNSAAFRIALLVNFEKATDSAQNALLKTLEEPPENVILLITAESKERLLPTIVSRCEVIRLRPVPYQDLKVGIQNLWQVPSEEANLLSHIASGRAGYCYHLFQNPELMVLRRQWLDDMGTLLSSNRIDRFNYADKLYKNRSQIYPLLNTWLGFWRDVLLVSRNGGSQITNIDYLELIKYLAQNLDKNTTFQVVQSLDGTFRNLENNVNPRLALEDLMLCFPFIPK
jgi:DNA polymerase-3 subunit delta'